jgi:hypothetical protein
MASASVHINKLSAAKRQLQAAIRLYFMGEDELAIHTVASAAYGILKDLKAERGQSEAADVVQSTYFYLVRDFHRGTLPKHMISDPVAVAEIRKIADDLPEITADSKMHDMQVSTSKALERQYWGQTNRTANFLKHASQDSLESLDLSTVDNDLLLARSCSAYQDVSPDDLGNEGLAFAAFTASCNPSYQASGTSFDKLQKSLQRVPIEERKLFCLKVVAKLSSKS